MNQLKKEVIKRFGIDALLLFVHIVYLLCKVNIAIPAMWQRYRIKELACSSNDVFIESLQD
jgi:hypothetical protein